MTSPEPSLGLLSQVDPRLKVIVLVLWSFLLAFLQNQEAALAGLGASAIIYALSGPKSVLKGLKSLLAINAFLLFIWLLLPFSFSYPGTVVYVLGPLKVTKEGLNLSILLSLKALSITLGALAITGSAGVFDLVAGARRLGAPEKMTSILLMMTRYVSVISQEYYRLRQAMKIRGFRPRTNLHTLRSYANLAGLLLVRGLDRAERVQAAMLCRGYNGRFWLKTDFKFKLLDLLVAFLFLGLSLVVAAIDRV